MNNAEENVIHFNGIVYRLGDDHWLTISRYAEKHGVTIHTIFGWIRRGVIMESDIVEIPELNNIKLVRDKVYNPKVYNKK